MPSLARTEFQCATSSSFSAGGALLLLMVAVAAATVAAAASCLNSELPMRLSLFSFFSEEVARYFGHENEKKKYEEDYIKYLLVQKELIK